MRKFVRAGIAGSVLLSSLVIGASTNWKDPSPFPEITLQIDPAKVAKDDGWARTDDGRLQVLVELTEPAASVAYAKATAGKSIRTPAVRSAAAAATRASIQRVTTQQKAVAAQIGKLGAREIYRVSRVMNGIAVAVEAKDLPRLRALHGVRRVLPIPRETPSLSSSVPFLGVPDLWENTLGLPNALTGTGVRIGIIDTGIDYLHADFGGTGALATYQAEDTTQVSPISHFPTAKVVGGTDLAGDAYTGSNAPAPDPNPMDCNGHGTHVAGIAAGYGVTSAGTTYNGIYDNATPFASLSIGPGAAPQASLYAIRVFGCAGSTGLTVQGIDWAMDPNGDNDFSDHLDVINMSLGSSYGSADDASSVAADAAAAAGVVVVISAGNEGDTYFITGSPGVSSRALTVAAIADSGIPGAALQVNSPPAIAGTYSAAAGATALAPAPTGQTGNIVAAIDPADGAGPQTTDGCSALTNAAAIAGNIALIDRGTCSFDVKVNKAQAAGAIGVIVANNAVDDPTLTTMGASTLPTATIPAIFVSKATGDAIRAQLGGGVNATLAAVGSGDSIASFSSRGPRRGDGASVLKPDIAAPGVSIVSAQTGKTCLPPVPANAASCITPAASGFIAGSTSLSLSGTSMAAPHMAGIMALLRQEHPDWSVEQLKALAMNGALHDVYLGAGDAPPLIGAGRAGAGRTDPAASAVSPVVALNADDSNLVSVSFRSYEVVGSASEMKKVRLVNTGSTPQTYNLSINDLVSAPGVTFSLPGGSNVTIPAGGSTTINVKLDAVAAQMKHARDASVAPTQAAPAPLTSLGNLARAWLTEASSNLVLSQGGVAKLRLPLYVATRPASTMTAPATIVTGGAPTGSTTIPLSGGDVCTGTLGAGPTCTAAFPNDEQSLVTPFELQVVHAQDESVAPPYANIQYAGVAYDAGSNVLMFGVSTWGDWATPTDVAFNIYIDANNDGTWDRILFNSNAGTMSGRLFGTTASGQDSFLTGVFNIATNGVSIQQFVNRVSAAGVDSVLFKNNVIFLAATPASLGLTGGATSFRYKIQTCPGQFPLCGQLSGFHYDEAAGPYTYNTAAQGLNFNGNYLADDLNGASLPVTWNTANMTTNGSLGALLLHHHNRSGERAEVVTLDSAQNVDLGLTQTVSAPSPTLGSNATFTVKVTNPGPNAASGVAVTDVLPAGLIYVSDTEAGAYDGATGRWTIPALASGANATLQIVATVVTTDQTCNLARITASTPLDTNPANDQATICVMSPRSSDLALSMSASPATAHAGDPLTYTLTVKNLGADTAYSLNVLNSFPAVPSLHASSHTESQGVYTPASGIWNIGSLAKDASATLSITVTAPAIVGALTNNGSATAGASSNDPDTSNNSANATVAIASPAVLTATKTVSGSFTPGGAVTYTVTISNGSAYAQFDNAGHEFSDTLPAALTLNSANATSGTAATSGNTVNWDGAVPANGSVTITINATIAANTIGQTISNQGTINYDADGNGTNEATAQTQGPSGGATTFVVLSPAALSATKTVAGSFTPGGAVTYTVTISNGSAYAQFDNAGHEFSDTLPAALTLNSVNATSGSAAMSGNTVNWDGAIPGGGTVTITINATIAADAIGQTISNQGTLSYDADGDGSNEATAQTQSPTGGPTSFVVLSASAMSATKTVAGSFTPGGAVTYTIAITNNSANAQFDNPGHEFIDVLPASLTLVSANASSGTVAPSGNTVNWDGAVPAGGTVTITINATIAADAIGQTISNQGTVNYDADGNGSNEATVQTQSPTGGPTSFVALSASSLRATETVAGSFQVGGTVVYTIAISNVGAATQFDNPGHEFEQTFPAQLTLVSATATSGAAAVSGNVVSWDGQLGPGGASPTGAGARGRSAAAAAVPADVPPNNVLVTVTAIIASGAGQTISTQGQVNFDADGNGSNEATLPTNDPTRPGSNNPTSFLVAAAVAARPATAPALDPARVALLALLCAIAGGVYLRRRQKGNRG